MTYVEHDVVVVGGPPALLIGVAMRDLLDRGTYFANVKPDVLTQLDTISTELVRAGKAWREALYASVQAQVNGSRANAKAEDPQMPALSAMTARQASDLLQVTPQRVRQIAPQLGGRKQAGRWLLDRDAVLAYAQQQRERANGRHRSAA